MGCLERRASIRRLRPDFNEHNYGCSTVGKLMAQVAKKSDMVRVWTEDSSLMVGIASAEVEGGGQQLNKSNWLPAFRQCLQRFKDDGFERINPSILKAAIQADYPDFDEKQAGFKRFSDIMKQLEKEGLLIVEMDEQRTMLLKIC